jgi:DNA excision repair protein ERCC-2
MSYVVAVRALCEFTARHGDLDLRFTPAPTSLEGMAGHVTVAGRRAASYETELALTGAHRSLTVRGRADGYDPVARRLEEIKTHRGDLERMPANHRALHWAQVLVYGHLLCRARGLAELTVALVYFDIGTQKETRLTQTHTARDLEIFFVEQCESFLDWAVQEDAHRTARNAALGALQFPHGQFRSGQRELAVSVYRAARDARSLMAQAPTGIGKTLATIFPLLKACASDQIDRVFFLTAKTPGRALALDAIETLHQSATSSSGPLPLRTLELVARDKACEHPDKACNGESCPLAHGFYDRLGEARATALKGPRLDRAAVREAALAHEICPYYLAQELARWADVVVGDYNYFYDGSAMLYALTQINQWRVGVLVDEAHNLLDRARHMYTASLDQTAFRLARKTAPKTLRRPLERLQREWNTVKRAQTSTYQVYTEVPGKLLQAAQNLIGAVTDQLADAPLSIDEASLRFFFEAMHFVALADHAQCGSLRAARQNQRHAVRAQRDTRAVSRATLCRGTHYGDVFRHARPIPFLSRHAGAAGRHATARRGGTVSRGTTGSARGGQRIDTLARPRALARADRRSDCHAVREPARQLLGVPEQLRVSGKGGRPDARAASRSAGVGAATRHG